MLPSYFKYIDDDLSDYNVGKIFGLSKILTLIWWHRFLTVIRSGLLVVCIFQTGHLILSQVVRRYSKSLELSKTTRVVKIFCMT